MKPRVLFVSRERVRLPLGGAQLRKWDALSHVLEPRIVAAAPAATPTRDERFRLAGPARVRALDGALYYLRLPGRIARELRSFDADAAIVQGVPEMCSFLLVRMLMRSRATAILEVHGDWRVATRLYGSPFRRLLGPLHDRLAVLVARRSDAVRTVSRETTELVQALGVEPTAMFTAFVDEETFFARPLQPLPQVPRALFVGVLERYKGFDTLVRAWRLAAPRVPDAALHLVGTGALQAEAERLVAELPAQTAWTPRLDPDGVASAMDAAWLLCLPSRSEGLPRVALEAVCRGRAVVGGARAGIPDVVRDGENGLLVDPEDAGGLADALVRVLSDRALAERLGAAARRTGEEWNVPPDEFAARVLALVRSTLS